jgi:hypothetical protein
MGAGARFEFSVVALDRYTKVLRDLNNKASKSVRPFQSLGRSASAFGRELHLNKLGAGLSSIAGHINAIGSSLGVSSPAMEALAGLGTGAGFVATGAAIGAMGLRVGFLGSNVDRAAARMNMSTRELQRFRGAADLAGLSTDDMDESLSGLAKTMQDARWGRNPAANALFNLYTRGVKTKADGSVDVAGQMLKVVDAAARIKDPMVRQNVLGQMGISQSLLPLITTALRSQMDHAEARGYVLSPQQIEQAKKFRVALGELNIAFSSLNNNLGTKVLPTVTAITKFLDRFITNPNPFSPNETTADGDDGASRPRPRGGRGVGAGPRGMRLNNPGNLEKWGHMPVVNGFAQFPDARAGLSAMATQLQIYQDRDQLNTVSGILAKYAPAKDGNNVPAYISDVSQRTGFGADQSLNLHDPKTMSTLMKAMVGHEQGKQPFSDDDYSKAAQQHVVITFKGLPHGASAVATAASGANVPTRIDRSLATTAE